MALVNAPTLKIAFMMRAHAYKVCVWKYVTVGVCFLFLTSCLFLWNCAQSPYLIGFSGTRDADKSSWGLPSFVWPNGNLDQPIRSTFKGVRNCGCDEVNSVPKCEVIQIAIVCAGYSSARQVITLVKSILFYRKNPLAFHFVVDSVSKLILGRLFDTWAIPGVAFYFYAADDLIPDVSWIPNRHYSGVYGLLKLQLPRLLPVELKRVIVLDTDIVFASDISELWGLCKSLNGDVALGLVDNQSDWYLGKITSSPWPAIERGFNTGLILMRLDLLRSIGWENIWKKVTKRELLVRLATSLADQDIFNTVLKYDPQLVLRLPCYWNLQLGDNAKEGLCPLELAELKVIHWNSPWKTKVNRNRHTEFFRKHYQSFVEFDGNLLRRELFHCPNATALQETSGASDELLEDDPCYELKRHQRINYRTHLFFFPFLYENNKDAKDSGPVVEDVTLVTQLSMDRFQMLERLLEHWEGPASIALYLSDSEALQLANLIQESSLLTERTNVAYHIIYKEGSFYPINVLRNVALEQAVTSNVFLVDFDFLPSFGLYEVLRQAIAKETNMTKKALIVPAFETQHYRFDFPKSKTELLKLLDSAQLHIFRHDVFLKGHSGTNYDRWRSAVLPYTVTWKDGFEPYVVVQRDEVPLFDTRFFGFGYNKVSHVMELDALGYDFIVLPNAFIIHLPHSPSFDISRFRTNSQFRRCLKLFKGEFMKDLAKRYNRARQIELHQLEAV